MDFFFFDVSALAKRYTPEAGANVVDQIFVTAPSHRLMCLTIGAAEVAHVLVRKRNGGRVSSEFLAQAFRNLRDEVIHNLDFATIAADDKTVIDSIGLIIRHSINSTDAIVLASTLHINEELSRQQNQLILVSSDKRLLQATQSEGLGVLNPETEEVDQ